MFRFPAFVLLIFLLAVSTLGGTQIPIQRFSSYDTPSNTKAPKGMTATDTFTYNGEIWTVFEDLSKIEGAITFESSSGATRNFDRYLEATYSTGVANKTIPLYFGLNSSEINLALNDVLADELLKNGEPIETSVRDVVPIQISNH